MQITFDKSKEPTREELILALRDVLLVWGNIRGGHRVEFMSPDYLKVERAQEVLRRAGHSTSFTDFHLQRTP
jgi:hypothetical protein